MSSNSAFYGDLGMVDYASAKMGVVGMTRSLARELAPFHINVNVVCPGAIRTRRTTGFRLSDRQGALQRPDGIYRRALRRCRRRRVPSSDDLPVTSRGNRS